MRWNLLIMHVSFLASLHSAGPMSSRKSSAAPQRRFHFARLSGP